MPKIKTPLTLDKVKPGTHAAQLLAMSKQPEGAHYTGLPGTSGMNAYHVMSRLVAGGVLFKGTWSGNRGRWFDSAERAAAWVEKQQQAAAFKAKTAGPTLRIAHQCGPARLPGEPVITSKTKFTKAPPPAPRGFRTNTHSPG